MRTSMPLWAALSLVLVSCGVHQEPATPEAPEAPEAHEAHDALAAKHIGECIQDPVCKARLDEPLLQGCPWYESAYCSAAVAAAAAACVVTEGEACLPAIEFVKSMGCCDCLPAGFTRDMCKDIP